MEAYKSNNIQNSYSIQNETDHNTNKQALDTVGLERAKGRLNSLSDLREKIINIDNLKGEQIIGCMKNTSYKIALCLLTGEGKDECRSYSYGFWIEGWFISLRYRPLYLFSMKPREGELTDLKDLYEKRREALVGRQNEINQHINDRSRLMNELKESYGEDISHQNATLGIGDKALSDFRSLRSILLNEDKTIIARLNDFEHSIIGIRGKIQKLEEKLNDGSLSDNPGLCLSFLACLGLASTVSSVQKDIDTHKKHISALARSQKSRVEELERLCKKG